MAQRILCLGLDGAGKSSLVNRLKFGDGGSQVVPTGSVNVTTLEFNGMKYTLWEVGGSVEARGAYAEYSQNTSGLIYVIDASDESRIAETREHLALVLADPAIADLPLLLYLNKSGRGNVLREAVVELGLETAVNEREVSI